MRPYTTLAAVAAAAVALAGCSGGGGEGHGDDPVDLELVSRLERFDSCDGIRSWARDELAPRVGAHGFPHADPGGLRPGGPVIADRGTTLEEAQPAEPGPGADGAAGEAAAPADGDPGAVTGPAGTTTYSETNVQVEGVDEPDIVKTDGERVLALVDGELHLASAAGRELLDTLALPGGHSGELLLSGDRVLVLATAASGQAPAREPGSVGSDVAGPGIPGQQGTAVTEVAMDGGNLELAGRYVLDGSYVSARMVDGVVRLVLQADPSRDLPLVAPAGSSDDAIALAEKTNREVVAGAEVRDLLPEWRRLGPGGDVVDEGMLLSCDQVHAPERFAGAGTVAVITIDMAEGLAGGIRSSGGAGVMARGQTVYASAEHLYVTAPEWVDWPSLSGEQQADAVDDIGTDIHRFDISDPASAVYEMSGRVAGWLLNQFALDEHDGHLRVATTTGSPWAEGAEQSESQVRVLEPGDGALVEIGTLSGLGRGETIHAVRFMGDAGYVVTFRQTDPLYTIDLSDPSDPRSVGELKMLGYSAYLHPVGDGRLLGVGQDATGTGTTQGTQVSLFDVSDPADPVRVAKATLPGATSAAEMDHRAFLWWARTGLAAVPVDAGGDSFSGLVGYRVDVGEGTLAEWGRVSHPGGGVVRPVPPDDPVPLPEPVEPGTQPGPRGGPGGTARPAAPAAPIMRSWVIGDELWTLSGVGLGVSDLETLGSPEMMRFR